MSRKKFLLFFSLAFLAIFLSTQGVEAYYPPKTGEGATKQQFFEESIFGTNKFNQESHSYSNVENVVASLNNMIVGCTTQSCQEKLGTSDAGGAVGGVTNLIASLCTAPPASSTYYLADLGQRLNITQPAYAQGIGFSGLTPLLPLWRAARNVAYIFFILVFILTGFAIIFRAKINPQTVVTIQSAIPKAVMALILVTFSYAIAGLVIDLMYFAIGLSLHVLQNFAGKSLFRDIPEYYNVGFYDLFHDVWDSGWGSFKEVLISFLPWVGGGVGATAGIGTIIGAIIGGGILSGGAIGLAAGSLGVGLLLVLIISIVLLYTVLRIFFTLLKAYVSIIISILVAPFQLMLSAIPGQNTFGSWLKGLLSNVVVFPAVIIMLTLAGILSKTTENLWVPPMLGSFGESTGEVAGAILGFGIVLMTPKVADIVKGMFERKPFEYGAAIGQALGPGQKIGKTVVGTGAEIGVSSVAEKATAGITQTSSPWKKGAKSYLQRRKIIQ